MRISGESAICTPALVDLSVPRRSAFEIVSKKVNCSRGLAKSTPMRLTKSAQWSHISPDFIRRDAGEGRRSQFPRPCRAGYDSGHARRPTNILAAVERWTVLVRLRNLRVYGSSLADDDRRSRIGGGNRNVGRRACGCCSVRLLRCSGTRSRKASPTSLNSPRHAESAGWLENAASPGRERARCNFRSTSQTRGFILNQRRSRNPG